LNEESEQKIIMECSISYSLRNGEGNETATGKGEINLFEDHITILPMFGEVLLFGFEDIVTFAAADYKLNFNLTSKEELVIADFGFKYEDFIRRFTRMKNELCLKEMLMQESLKKSGVKGQFQHLDRAGNETVKGECNLRVYETALVIMPDTSNIIRIPFNSVTEVEAKDYTLRVITERKGTYVLSMLGKKTDPFNKALSDTMNELNLKTQIILTELIPNANPAEIRIAARFMKDGRAASREEIDSVSPTLWIKLEERLEVMKVKDEYNNLINRGCRNKMWVGVKRGLMGDITGTYIWFFIPIHGREGKGPGNAIAMEAASDVGGGMASYFFRIAPNDVYSSYTDAVELDKLVEELVIQMNECMMDINFRREPIYLSEQKLLEPKYDHYRDMMNRIPSISVLRDSFIGRVHHRSKEQWELDVQNLLEFNARNTDSKVKWNKNDDESEEPQGEPAVDDNIGSEEE